MEDLHHIREIEEVSRGRAGQRAPVVVQSWLRCLNQHRLDPAARSEAYILPDSALRLHRQRSEDLIAIARSGIEHLYSLVAGQNYVLMLADSAGVTVEYLGDPAQKAALRRSGLYLGAEWSEERAGTCALGACIETGEALIIHQSDHFDLAHTGLSCTAAPIYDTGGRLAAVLDISLLSSPLPPASQSLALNLVRQSARRIEMANLMAESRREWVLRLSAGADFLDVDPEAAVSLDTAGRVIGMTNGAARLMARAAGLDWRGSEALIGRPISDFLDISLDRLEGLTRQRQAAERFVETRDGHRLFAHAIEPRPAPLRAPPRPERLPQGLRGLAGADPVMELALGRAAALAASPLPLLIEGETGTGKLTLARAIHALAGKGPLVVLPCAGLAEEDGALLFGRAGERGGGMIAEAGGGTLVLDKVEELPPGLQRRFLRLAAEDGALPVGGVRAAPLPLRIIATSQCDLGQAAAEGRFRADLFHRLNGALIRLPALRHRQDLLWLAERAFAEAFATPTPLSVEVVEALSRYDWPGNLRELGYLARALAVTATGRAVLPADVPRSAAHVPQHAEGEAAQLLRALEDSGGNISEAARRLGVNRSTIHRQMHRFGLKGGAGR